jgi:hypothetical protein
MRRAGLIRWVLRQVTITLGVPQNTYRVDFVLQERDGSIFAEDVKSIETREFKRHKRLWRSYGPFPLRILKGKTVEVIVPDDTAPASE